MRKPKVVKERKKRQGRKFVQEVDANVVSLPMKVLKSDAQLAAGDPEFCGGCSAVFNMYSKLLKSDQVEDVKMDDDDQLWRCEFCGHNNVINLETEEIPTKDAVNYVLEHPNVGEDSNMEDIAVIFCLDTSGSMCVSK